MTVTTNTSSYHSLGLRPKRPVSERAARRNNAAGRRFAGVAWKSASLVLVFVLWEALPRLGIVDAVWFPPFSQVLAAAWKMLQSGELTTHIESSIVRSTTGFTLAASVAVPLGLTIGWYSRVRTFLTSLLEFFRNTSALALLPVFILFLGIGEASKVGIVTFACFFPILLSTIAGVNSVDPLLIKSARSLNLSAPMIFTKIILPSAVPSVFTGFRLAAQSSILVLIAAEMVGATSGLGYLINYAQFNFLIAKMYAGILTIALLGLAINHTLVATERRLSRWRVAVSDN